MRKIKAWISKHKPVFWILGALALVWLVLRFSPYPDFDSFRASPRSTRYYDRDGNLIQVTSLGDGLRREWTDYKELPPDLRKAFVYAEDRRFYSHSGVDLAAIANALYQNLRAGHTVRGASTITMQLVKMASPNSERNLRRKLSDAVNACRIEARLSKKQILELYLNSVPFGQNCEGVTSAARTFFGKELEELSLEEICCLAIIPRNPASYNPLQRPGLCAERAAEVFRLPLEDLTVAASQAKRFLYPFNMPHYIEYISSQPQPGSTPYEIHLPVSLEIQEIAERYIKEAVSQAAGSRISNAALLLIDNSDGSVLSWIGNPDWFDSAHSGQLDGVLVRHQPGSSMKPFLYALALDTEDENGAPLFMPSAILPDVPLEFGTKKIYIPENFNNRFNGPVRLRIALASSLNVPAVYVLSTLGVDSYLQKLYELGFDSLKLGGKQADLGLALGAGEVTLKELVTAFSVFPRDGLDYRGRQLYTRDTARLICSILSDKDARALGFGYTQTFQTDYPSIFKTGTSNQYQNITALGATKDYTIGVWMGNFSGQTVMGKTGSSLPAWVAKNVLDFLERGRAVSADRDFPEPEAWEKIKICPLSGMAAGADCPSSVFEYVKKGTEAVSCAWHKKADGELKALYPPEYQAWLRQGSRHGQIAYSASQLKIITPKDNSLFYYTSMNSQAQAIPVEIIGGTEDEAAVFYDDKFFSSIERPFITYLPVEKGSHTCRIVCGSEVQEISFEVR